MLRELNENEMMLVSGGDEVVVTGVIQRSTQPAYLNAEELSSWSRSGVEGSFPEIFGAGGGAVLTGDEAEAFLDTLYDANAAGDIYITTTTTEVTVEIGEVDLSVRVCTETPFGCIHIGTWP